MNTPTPPPATHMNTSTPPYATHFNITRITGPRRCGNTPPQRVREGEHETGAEVPHLSFLFFNLYRPMPCSEPFCFLQTYAPPRNTHKHSRA